MSHLTEAVETYTLACVRWDMASPAERDAISDDVYSVSATRARLAEQYLDERTEWGLDQMHATLWRMLEEAQGIAGHHHGHVDDCELADYAATVADNVTCVLADLAIQHTQKESA